MGQQLIVLSGFAKGLAELIAAGFRFSGEFMKNIELRTGRHLFWDYLPDVSELRKDVQLPEVFDPAREPAIAIFGAQGAGLRASSSSGSKHYIQSEIQLRLPNVPEASEHMLAELLAWLKRNAVGRRAGPYLIKGCNPQGFPGQFSRLTDGMLSALARVQFLAVPSRTS